MAYNIVCNGNFSSISSDTTLSGIGTASRCFTAEELQTISNNILTVSGVSINAYDSVMLKLDMSERIRVDGIRVYCDNVTLEGVNAIHVYWKDYEEDFYSGSDENYSSDYYYATLPDPSAPRYIIVTISGLDTELFEFAVYNYDYIIGFGEDGTQTMEQIEDSPIGTVGAVQTVEIYNNSNKNMPATAYACVDCTDNDADYYLEIGTSPNGPFYSLNDGAVIEDNITEKDYTWNMGEFDEVVYDELNKAIAPECFDVGFYAENIGSLPLNYTANSWYTAQNTWDYDPISRNIYAVGADGSLKLYKFNIDDKEWIYIGEMAAGLGYSDSQYSNIAVMCYMDGYVYAAFDFGAYFGRYKVDGPTDNWEALPSVGFTGLIHYIGMCSDKDKYIYVIKYDMTVADVNNEFRRYDTTTSGWSALNSSYSNNRENNIGVQRRACLTYDVDRDYIYAVIGGRHNGDYIQRYHVSSDTWNVTYHNTDLTTNNGGNNDHETITYYNDYLIYVNANCGSNIYYLHIPTDTWGYFTSSIGGFYDNGHDALWNPPYVVATDHPVGLADLYDNPIGVAVWASQLSVSRGNMYNLNSTYINSRYTSPIVSLENKFNSSYVVIDNEGLIAVNDNSIDTIEVRSSDIEPVPIYEAWLVHASGRNGYYNKWNPYLGSFLSSGFMSISTINPVVGAAAAAVDHIDGRQAYSLAGGRENPYGSPRLYILDRNGTQLYYSIASGNYTNMYNDQFYFDGAHGVWGYGNYDSVNSRILSHHNNDASVIASYSEGQVDFIYEIATELVPGMRGVWYTNQTNDTLVHMNSDCVKLQTIQLDQPRCVASTMDGGVWVADNIADVIYRYSFDGTRTYTFTVSEDISYNGAGVHRLSGDFNNGFWYRNGDLIRHVTEDGVVDVGPVPIEDANTLGGTPVGCFVHNTNDNKMYWIDMNGQTIYKDINDCPSLFGGFYYGHSQFVKYKSNYIPVSYDPVWGDEGSLEWKTVPKNGYFLERKKYHQFRFTLKSPNTKLKKIIMAPAVKIEDIRAGSYKSIYLRTNIPEGADIMNYESGLKVWWDVEDS